MKLPPCTQNFASLATSPYSHAEIGNLAAIHTPGINLVLGARTFSPAAMSAIEQLDVRELALLHGDPYTAGGSKYGNLGGGKSIGPNQLFSTVGPVLERILPPHKGNRAIARDLAHMLGDIAGAYDNSPLDFFMVANLAGSQGVFHHDNYTEHRWLVTVPTPEARGTWTIDNFARERQIRLDRANPAAGQGKGAQYNNYGRPTPLWSHLIREAPVGRVLGWHGEESATPLIHSEPDVLSDAQARLTVVATPSAMVLRETQRRNAVAP